MRKILSSVLMLGLLASFSSGCAAITSGMGGNTSETGEAWYTNTKMLFSFPLSSKVFYCPAPASGPAQCKEAKMVEQPKK